MLFNSVEFAVFITIVFVLYWFVTDKNLKVQNALLLIASYLFYGWWDWRFLFLLTLLSLANYFIGLAIGKNETNSREKIWLIIGLITNIGVLCVFKYYNFFIDSFIDLVSLMGYNLPRSTTKIILPLGISFYVFLSLSYIIDIYKKNLHANGNITVCFYLVDLLCLGVKDTHYMFNITETKYREQLYDISEQMEIELCDYTLVHNIIFAGLEFAEEYGFKPHKDFTSVTEFMLEEDTDDIELIEIECGRDGKPLYIQGPFDDAAKSNKIMKQIECEYIKYIESISN